MNNPTSALRLIIAAIIALGSSNMLQAQNKESIRIRTHYRAKFFLYEGQETKQVEETILDAGNRTSHFYCLNSIKREEIRDSILAKGGDMGEIMNAWDKLGYPRANMHYQVWKNHPAPNTLTFTDTKIKHFKYTELMSKPEWTLIAKDSIVADYNCQQAETFYLGRHWKVWFTMDIPIQDGPWKLYGLPGLILHAEDSEHLFSFSCIQIENVADEYITVSNKKSIQCTKKEYEDLIRLNWKDPIAFSERMTGFRGDSYDAKGKPLSYPERKAILLEK